MTNIIEHNEEIMKVAREDHEWLGVVDIYKHAPVKLTVKRVVKFKDGKFEQGRSQNGQAVEFEETAKRLPLNATNSKALAKEYGSTPEEVKGKQIVLAVEKLPRDFNGHTHGIRIKPNGEKQ